MREEVPLTFQQAVEHLRALRNFCLFTNQLQVTASICQAEELLETEQCSKANCFKQRTINAFFIESMDSKWTVLHEFSVDRNVCLKTTGCCTRCWLTSSIGPNTGLMPALDTRMSTPPCSRTVYKSRVTCVCVGVNGKKNTTMYTRVIYSYGECTQLCIINKIL